MNKKTIVVLSNVTTGLVNFRNELLGILSSDYRVVVVAEDTGRADELIALGCEFCNISIDRHGTNPITELQLIRLYIDLLKRYKPFIVLSYTIKPNIYGGIACSHLTIPYIPNVTGLGDAIENKGLLSIVAKNLYRLGLRKANKVFFQNQANCDFFIKNSLYRGSYDVLPGSGVNLTKHPLEEYPNDLDDAPQVLSVIGRITKDKGIEEILKASEHFSPSQLSIQLIGDCEGQYLKQIQVYSEKGVVQYFGRQENIHEWVKKSNAILHASYHEGMSNVLLEAAACGRPVIATNIPGCREAFDNGVTGIGFEPHNVDALVAAVRQFCLLSYEQKRQMGIAGRQKMESSFDRRIVVEKYLNTIKAIEGAKENETV